MASANLENSAQTFHADRNLIAGRYRTHTRIGHGRLGEIFTTIDEGVEEPGVEPHLAIQTIPESVVRNNRLFNKINVGYTILRSAAHPNIVNFRHFGRDGKFGYLVMDLLDGLSLRSVLDGAEILTLDEAKPIIRGVGEALQHLHTKDIVHGNLTTSNVFITHELEVRLLDVLPLDPAEPIMHDTATGRPFSRCTREDDVFDLACLAYEMLTGQHPFNYKPPAEARLAGLEAHRVASLTDGEWSALRRALSFDREQRTSSVAEFIRDFGIGGTEHLLPTAEPVATVASTPWIEKGPPNASPIRKRARPLRAVLLGILLAELCAWSYYGQPQEDIVDLISYVGDRIDVGLTEKNDAFVEISTPVAARSVPTDGVALIEEIVVTVAQPTVQLAPAAPMQAEPELIVTESIVSVSERDGAAQIAPPRTEDSAMPLIWWTSEHTANADTDFIAVEQQTMAVASIGDSDKLYVPLVNDDQPEPAESFFVSFGLRNTQQGQVERIATVRVDIVDDDLP